jgi:hypothetical protein
MIDIAFSWRRNASPDSRDEEPRGDDTRYCDVTAGERRHAKTREDPSRSVAPSVVHRVWDHLRNVQGVIQPTVVRPQQGQASKVLGLGHADRFKPTVLAKRSSGVISEILDKGPLAGAPRCFGLRCCPVAV